MFRVTVTDLRTNQSDVFSADVEKIQAIKKMLTPSKGADPEEESPPKKKTKKSKTDKMVIHGEEFFKVIRRDYTGKPVTEDGKFIEFMNGQRLEKYYPSDTFSPESSGVYQDENGDYFLKLHLDPSRHGGKRVRMVKLVPQT